MNPEINSTLDFSFPTTKYTLSSVLVILAVPYGLHIKWEQDCWMGRDWKRCCNINTCSLLFLWNAQNEKGKCNWISSVSTALGKRKVTSWKAKQWWSRIHRGWQTAFNLPFQWGGDKRLYFNQALNIVKQRELTSRSPSNQHDFNCTCSSIWLFNEIFWVKSKSTWNKKFFWLMSQISKNFPQSLVKQNKKTY